MKRATLSKSFAWTAAVLFVAVLFAGCNKPTPSETEGTTPEGQSTSETGTEETPTPPVEESPTPGPEETRIPGFESGKMTAEISTEPRTEEPGTPSAEETVGPTLEPPAEPGTEETAGSPTIEVPEVPGVQPFEMPEETEAPKRDLGPPLVDNVDELTPLPAPPLWIDKTNKRVIMVGEICQTEAPLELFACLKNTKEHEAVVVVDVKAMNVHAGLLAVGANPGNPVMFDPNYVPASGDEIEVSVAWKDAEGKVQTARAQDWIYDTETEKAMAYPWVFAGSGFWVDETTGEKHYQAEGGDLICVSNFSSAMLDVPVESTQTNSALMFNAYTERIPPRGTPVTLILTPKPKPDGAAKE